MTIEETLQIALDAHRGQKDLDGRPALLHPIAVGLMGSNDTEIMTGFLHDVVEDTALTLEDLRGKGVEEDVLAALQLLTHDDGQDYFEYVRRIAESGNITAIHVKTNDLRHPRRGAGRHGHDGASCPHQRQAPQGAASAELPMWNAECVRNAVSFVRLLLLVIYKTACNSRTFVRR